MTRQMEDGYRGRNTGNTKEMYETANNSYGTACVRKTEETGTVVSVIIQ